MSSLVIRNSRWCRWSLFKNILSLFKSIWSKHYKQVSHGATLIFDDLFMMLIIEETPCPAQLSTGLHDQPRRCCQSRNHNWSMLCWSQTGKPFPLQKYIKLFHQCPQTKKRFCCKNKKVISKFMKQRRDLFPAICEVSAIHREKLTSPRFQRFKSNCAPFNWYQQWQPLIETGNLNHDLPDVWLAKAGEREDAGY